MPEMLYLKPEDEKRLYPEALQWFNARKTEIGLEVPLQEITDEDLNAFLSEDEKREFQRYMDEISEGLRSCVIGSYTSSTPIDNINPRLNILKFQWDSFLSMYRIELLLKNVYQRKLVKAAHEQKERDEEEKKRIEQADMERKKRGEKAQWQTAYREVNPPLNDAKRYLNKEELNEFTQVVRDAIAVYLGEGKEYLNSIKTFEYRSFLNKISVRKESENLLTAAKVKAGEYNQLLNKERVRLAALLHTEKKDIAGYIQEVLGNSLCKIRSFIECLSNEEKHAFDSTVLNISTRKLDKIIPENIRQFIDTKSCCYYCSLPSAEYSFDGVPCLSFMFNIYAVVETEVWIKPGVKNIDGYIFNLPWREEKGYSVILQEPEFMGYSYNILRPEDFGGYVYWQSIPLILLHGLLRGDNKPDGVTIVATSEGTIDYRIKNFRDEVAILESFAVFLKDIGSIGEMVNLGIITESVADIIRGQPEGLKPETVLPISRHGDTMKANAFYLFSQGKNPSSPELKALGMHKSTRFKYYTQFREINRSSSK